MAVATPRIAYDGRALVASHGHHEPRGIVLHDTESHDAAGIRDLAGIATFWHGVSWGPGAHRGIDSDGLIALYVDDDEVGYHVAKHNTGMLGIEQIGFARFAPSVWIARPKQLEACAQQIAYWHGKYDIPLRLDVQHGVSTHAMQSRAFRGDHYDPGTGYPLQRVLRRAEEIAANGFEPQPTKPYTEDPFWLWLRWRLGEGEFKTAGPMNMKHRPRSLPERVPDKWWKRQERFLAMRKHANAKATRR